MVVDIDIHLKGVVLTLLVDVADLVGSKQCHFFKGYSHSILCFVCLEHDSEKAVFKCDVCGISTHSSCVGYDLYPSLPFRCDVCIACGDLVDEGSDVGRVLFTLVGIKIYVRNLLRLCPGGWVDDNVIGLFISATIRSYHKSNRVLNCACVSSFFIPLLRSRGYDQAVKSLCIFTLDFGNL